MDGIKSINVQEKLRQVPPKLKIQHLQLYLLQHKGKSDQSYSQIGEVGGLCPETALRGRGLKTQLKQSNVKGSLVDIFAKQIHFPPKAYIGFT